MADDLLDRPLTAVEDRLIYQVADAVEAAFGGRDPALVIELCAHLIAPVLLDHAVRTKGDAESCEAEAWNLIGHIMTRVNALGIEANAGLLGAAVPAGHA
jgi:hypothetical protein